MIDKLKSISNCYRKIRIGGFLIICIIYPAQVMAGEMDSYRYTLEQNNNNKVCSHMADVYNRYFREPFKVPIDEAEYEKAGGKFPPLLPGGNNDWPSFIRMSLSFYPTSSEFDAIKWQRGLEMHHYHGQAGAYLNTPFIAADMDLNNDGQLETVIKDAFMCYRSGCDSAGSDVLFIFRKGDIDLMKGPIEWDVFFKGQNDHPPLAVIYGPQSSCDLVRPFIYDGATYLSCYHRKWKMQHYAHNFQDVIPIHEYTDVLKYQGVEKLPDGRSPIKAETVCRFRMTVVK